MQFFFAIIMCLLDHRSLRIMKHRFHLTGIVQIHHVIPQEHRNHPCVIEHDINIDAYPCVMFLPTRKHIIKTKRLVHNGGHVNYNLYVKKRLDEINTRTDLYNLVKGLRFRIRTGSCSLPWK